MQSANPLPLIVATRSPDKWREIAAILQPFTFLSPRSLADAGLPPEPTEDGIEAFDTFEENALAKARHFAQRLGVAVIADDSGLCVDALGGAPGVRSKRYAAEEDRQGLAVDAANNRKLLDELRNVPSAQRSARYICVAAFASPGGGREEIARGTCEGIILDTPAGKGGFGYDPLFFVPSEGCTFAEMDIGRKNRISHRAVALTAMAETLMGGVDSETPSR